MKSATHEAEGLSVLTWNLAMLEASDQAPRGWSPEHSEAAVVAAAGEFDAEVICFQELPAMVPFVATHDMVKANPESHQGHLATLLRHGLTTANVASASFLVMTTLAATGLTIANVHLAPGSGATAAAQRRQQLAAIIAASPTEALLVVGDTNTRADEIDDIVALGLHTTSPPMATWDSRRNRFHDGGPRFTAHFTRWFATSVVEVDEVVVHATPVVVDDHRFHVSDHFPLSLTATVRGPR